MNWFDILIIYCVISTIFSTFTSVKDELGYKKKYGKMRKTQAIVEDWVSFFFLWPFLIAWLIYEKTKTIFVKYIGIHISSMANRYVGVLFWIFFSGVILIPVWGIVSDYLIIKQHEEETNLRISALSKIIEHINKDRKLAQLMSLSLSDSLNSGQSVIEIGNGSVVLLNMPSYSQFEIAEESRFIKAKLLPTIIEEVHFVIVISPPKLAKQGDYTFRGSSYGSWEEFRTEYTVYTFDYKNSVLLGKELIFSDQGAVGWSSFLYGSGEESQDEARDSILYWMRERGLRF